MIVYGRSSGEGFSVLELLIAVAIVAVLAAMAVPSYLHYMKKSHYNELVQTADRIIPKVSACLKDNNGDASKCSAGEDGIPQNTPEGAGRGQIDAVTINNGVITIIPREKNGISSTDTYILSPQYDPKKGVNWAAAGGGCVNGLTIVHCTP